MPSEDSQIPWGSARSCRAWQVLEGPEVDLMFLLTQFFGEGSGRLGLGVHPPRGQRRLDSLLDSTSTHRSALESPTAVSKGE